MTDYVIPATEDAPPSSVASTFAKVVAQSQQILPWLLLISALVAILVWLGNKSAIYDAEQEQAFRSQAGLLKETDALLDVAILEAKAGLRSNYDEVSSRYNALLTQTEAFQASTNVLQMADGASVKLLSKAEAKGALVDKFKAQHALYSNSLIYLPQSVANLRKLVAQHHMGKRIDDLARSILALSLDYAVIEDEAKVSELRHAVIELSSLDGLPDDIDKARRELVMHAYSVMAQKSIDIQLFHDLAAIKFRAQVDNIATRFQQHFDAEHQSAQYYRMGLIAFSALLLTVLALLSYRLLQSFRLINLANATLEDNVAKRTSDLNQALQQLQSQHAQIIQQEKMASLGQMVAGVAHEINTPLGYLRSGLQSARVSVPLFGQLAQAVEQMLATMVSETASQEDVDRDLSLAYELAVVIREDAIVEEMDELLKNGLFGVDQISDIVINLKDFSRLDSKSMVTYSTTDCINSTLKIATNIIKKVTIQKNISDVPQLEGFPSQINQVLLNLISNACHATEDRPHAKVSVTQLFDAQAQAIHIDIADNGQGMSKEVEAKIFDPFFTTKKVGQGTGLGLHISRQIIEAHKGKISVVSAEGEGTIFTIVLPVG